MALSKTSNHPLHQRSGLAAAGFAAALLTAATSILSAGEAKAVTCNFVLGKFQDCSLGQPYDSSPISDKIITFLTNPYGSVDGTDLGFTGSGEVRFETFALGAPGFTDDAWDVVVDFNPGLVGPIGPISFDYTIQVTDPNWRFLDASLDLDRGAGQPTVTKQIYSDEYNTLIWSNTNETFNAPITGSLSQIWVRDTYTLGGSDVLDTFTNSYRQTSDVPGPLPLLGAGAAFGFSRKLRRRINGARQLNKG